jgi:hypothetical protein
MAFFICNFLFVVYSSPFGGDYFAICGGRFTRADIPHLVGIELVFHQYIMRMVFFVDWQGYY